MRRRCRQVTVRPPPKIRSVHQCISGYLGHCTQDSLEEIALPHSIHTYPHHVYTLLFYTCFSASPQRLIAVLADGGDVLWSLSEVPSPPSAACFSLSPSVLDVLIPSAHISKPQRCSILDAASRFPPPPFVSLVPRMHLATLRRLGVCVPGSGK